MPSNAYLGPVTNALWARLIEPPARNPQVGILVVLALT